MRKSFVLIIVLALATSAEAAVSLSLSATTVAVDNTVTCSIYSDNAEPWTLLLVLSEDTYAWTDPVAAEYDLPWIIEPYAGDLGIITPDPTYRAILHLSAAGATEPPQAGVQFVIPIKGVQPGTIYLDLQNGSQYPPIIPEPLTLVVVPEPMTSTLLALGGLLICRRGKN
ncbi:MAG: hypothetical protein JW947_04740 [Sedimentisphaerales bacterium]|nr:hypothetical protein [Sedimentisphaerales bacterium]